MSKYKKIKDFQTRIEESQEIMNKYPDRIPIILEKNIKSEISDIKKNKYLVPKELVFSNFIFSIRKYIELDNNKSLFFFINNYIPKNSELICEIYNTHKDKDGYLYIIYDIENTFG